MTPSSWPLNGPPLPANEALSHHHRQAHMVSSAWWGQERLEAGWQGRGRGGVGSPWAMLCPPHVGGGWPRVTGSAGVWGAAGLGGVMTLLLTAGLPEPVPAPVKGRPHPPQESLGALGGTNASCCHCDILATNGTSSVFRPSLQPRLIPATGRSPHTPFWLWPVSPSAQSL